MPAPEDELPEADIGFFGSGLPTVPAELPEAGTGVVVCGLPAPAEAGTGVVVAAAGLALALPATGNGEP